LCCHYIFFARILQKLKLFSVKLRLVGKRDIIQRDAIKGLHLWEGEKGVSMIRSLSHFLLALVFISGGSSVFINPDKRAERVAAAGIPQPREATMLNGAIMTIAGTMLALDLAPKLAALALLGTLIPTTVVGHPFWKETTPAERASHQTQFLKNLAIMGGLLAVLAEKNER
jgi:putative oxidoreductase